MNVVGGINGLEAALRYAGRSVCLVTHELAGLDRNGGIGSYCLQLARVLAENGALVEVLYADERFSGPRSNDRLFRETRATLSDIGIKLTNIAEVTDKLDRSYQSFQVMDHLRSTQPDIAVFSESNAAGYYSLIAKRTSDVRLASTTLCVVAHGATEWSNALNQIPVRSIEGVNIYEMERRCVELADVLICPSAFLIDRYEQSGWQIPKNRIVLPNSFVAAGNDEAGKKLANVKNIAFFSRLEARKGLWVFCAAMDRLRPLIRGKTITFLGKPVMQNGVSTDKLILQRSASWPCRVSLITNYDTDRALSYLTNTPHLAVMPSIEDNSPSVIVECMAKGIPFIASDRGGGKELVAAADRETAFAPPQAAALAGRLADTFQNGCKVAEPAFDRSKAAETYLQKLDTAMGRSLGRRSATTAKKRKPASVNYVLLADSGHSSEHIATAIRKIHLANGPGTNVVVVSEKAVSPAAARQISQKMPAKVSVVGCDCGLAGLSGLLSKTAGSMTVLSHVRQIVSRDLVDRAAECFGSTPSIAAVTAMTADAQHEDPEKRGPEDNLQPQKPVRDFLYSTSPVMLFLSGSSNAGFAVVQTRKFRELSDLSFHIPSSMKLKDARDIVHEIILKLVESGNEVEPVPDVILPAGTTDVRTPTFDLINVLRSSLGTMYGYKSGSDDDLLARLAVEVVAVDMRERRQSEYLEKIRKILKDRVPDNYAIGSGSVSELVLIANALSHRETANELVKKACLPDMAPAEDIDTHIERQASSVDLYEALKERTNTRAVNLNHKWSMKLWDKERRIELHPNSQSEGRASVEFSSLDLRRIESFHCDVAVPNSGAGTVRFRVDVIEPDGGNGLCEDRVMTAGDSDVWEIDLTQCRSRDSKLILSVEMADPTADPAHSFTHWNKPVLRGTQTAKDDEL